MTRGVPELGYRMRKCSECWEMFDPRKGEITHEQFHYLDDDCTLAEWLDYQCGCKDTRKRIQEKLGLDTEEKEDEYYDNIPDCTCEEKKFGWICEDCKVNSC